MFFYVCLYVYSFIRLNFIQATGFFLGSSFQNIGYKWGIVGYPPYHRDVRPYYLRQYPFNGNALSEIVINYGNHSYFQGDPSSTDIVALLNQTCFTKGF